MGREFRHPLNVAVGTGLGVALTLSVVSGMVLVLVSRDQAVAGLAVAVLGFALVGRLIGEARHVAKNLTITDSGLESRNYFGGRTKLAWTDVRAVQKVKRSSIGGRKLIVLRLFGQCRGTWVSVTERMNDFVYLSAVVADHVPPEMEALGLLDRVHLAS